MSASELSVHPVSSLAHAMLGSFSVTRKKTLTPISYVHGNILSNTQVVIITSFYIAKSMGLFKKKKGCK
jgi:hypothetical protein